MTIGMLGDMIGPIQAEAQVIPQLKNQDHIQPQPSWEF